MPRKLNLIVKTAMAASAAAIAASWYVRKVWLFRDPLRTPEREGRVITAPVDGKIVYVKPVKNSGVVTGGSTRPYPLTLVTKDDTAVEDGWIIGIFVTALDAHFQYAPIPGVVSSVTHVPETSDIPMLDLWEELEVTLLRRGSDLFDRTAHFENEREVYRIDGDGVDVVIAQVAERATGPVTTFVTAGDKVERAQKMAFMQRGVLVDLIIPKSDIRFHKDVSNQVYGAQTVIASY